MKKQQELSVTLFLPESATDVSTDWGGVATTGGPTLNTPPWRVATGAGPMSMGSSCLGTIGATSPGAAVEEESRADNSGVTPASCGVATGASCGVGAASVWAASISSGSCFGSASCIRIAGTCSDTDTAAFVSSGTEGATVVVEEAAALASEEAWFSSPGQL